MAGRVTSTLNTNGETPVSPSVDPTVWENKNIPVSTQEGLVLPSPHRALETDEIKAIVQQFRIAAQNAMKAGFDGVEILAGNSHLVEQFVVDSVNHRTDRYGGSIENRVRFLIEILQEVIDVWGPDRVGVRVAPSSTYGQVGDSDPHALFGYIAERLNELNVAYFHIIEPRISGADTIQNDAHPVASAELRKIFRGPLISVGGYKPETAEAAVADGTATLISFGRWFCSIRQRKNNRPVRDEDLLR